jgi:hypothetical protein
MIRYGIQDNLYAYKHIDQEGIRTCKLEPIKEKYVRFVMPWKRMVYSINSDREERVRPTFAVYWHRHPFARCTFIRMGWG